MIHSVFSVLASTGPSVPVPDSAITGWLLGGSLLGILAIARFIKSKRK